MVPLSRSANYRATEARATSVQRRWCLPGKHAMNRHFPGWLFLVGSASVAVAIGRIAAQEGPRFTRYEVQTNQEMRLQLSGVPDANIEIDVSSNLVSWLPLVTLATGGGVADHTDAGAALRPSRFYRALQSSTPNGMTGDHWATGAEVATIHPVNHATFVLALAQATVYVDPVGGAARFQGLPRPDLVLITHEHGDHFDLSTLKAVVQTNTVILATKAVYQALSTALRAQTTVLTNGAATEVAGIEIRAIPAYNLTLSFHPKGTGNGYVLRYGGKQLYISGDTEDIPEMQSLEDIDIAFVCVNLPYTMTVEKAAAVVRQFRPRVVYPYHYRNADSTFSNLNKFKQLVGLEAGVEVRLRNWY